VLPIRTGQQPAPVDSPRPSPARRPAPPGPLAAVLAYLTLRAIGLVVLAAGCDHPLWRVLTRYDGLRYATIVSDGYDRAAGPGLTNLAFFPLYPGLTALVRLALPVHVLTAALLVSWAAGLAAATGLYAVGAHLGGRRTGLLLAALWAVLPHGLVESMACSETLFTALAAWTLLAALRKHWLTAGLCCVAAGLTRPTAAALVAAVGLAALAAVRRRPADWRAWCGLVVAPLGLLGYVAWVGRRLGRWDGYLWVQRHEWKMTFDGGPSTIRTLHELTDRPLPIVYAVTTAVVLAGMALFVIGIGERLPWPLLVYAAGVLILVLGGAGYYYAKARLLMPAFPLLLPVAYALARTRNRTVPVVVLTGLTALSALYGVYLAEVWTYSP
jgi:hypothetical protein